MRLKNHTQLRVMVNISEESEKINCSLILYTICLPFYSLAFRGTKKYIIKKGTIWISVCGRLEGVDRVCMLTADIRFEYCQQLLWSASVLMLHVRCALKHSAS